ncbi:hypothetical protein ACFSYH_12985 [Populibacterium corticicola]|uniref:DUF4815 domain-containing protein n=1 Tax=Populibacterium corticicola TaxID=1812826 RepID=A0ABW5XIE6_9MICO
MTAQFDGYESDTLFNSMQEGGQGVFSLMVDLKNIVEFDSDGVARFARNASAVEPAAVSVAGPAREVLVGQEIRLSLTERSVSPIAGDLKVVWSNGYEGPTYHVRPEDLGKTLTATATFEGADMRPLEVTIECGPVVLASAPEIDRSYVTLTGDALGEQGAPDSGVREFSPAYLYVDSAAFSPAVDSIDVAWLIGGDEVAAETGILPQILDTNLDVTRVGASRNAVVRSEGEVLSPMERFDLLASVEDLEGLPRIFAELLGGEVLPGGAGEALDRVDHEVGKAGVRIKDAGALAASDGDAPEAVDLGQGESATFEPRKVFVDATQPFFTAVFTPPQGSGGNSLTARVTAHRQGAESAVFAVNAGWIGSGAAYSLRDGVAVRVATPRVGEEAWVKVKRKDFEPAAQTLSYQWCLNGQEIPGETESRIEVTPAMRGRELSVFIEASGANAMTTTLDASLGVVGLGDAPEYLGEELRIKGKPRAGEILKIVLEHEFVYPMPDSVEVQWMRGKEIIRGARAMTYPVDLSDVDEKIWARVLLRRLGHATTVLKTPKVRIKST